MAETPNRYGAQGLTTDDGEPCCCHMVPLTDICDGCEALRKTKRKPSLVGVDAVRMNPLNDDGASETVAVPAGVGYQAPVAGLARMMDENRPRIERELDDSVARALEDADTDDFAEDVDDVDELEDVDIGPDPDEG